MADNSLEEALNTAEESAESSNGRTPLVIDNDLRTIYVPQSEYVFGVYNDKDVLAVPFQMPRYYDGLDLSEFSIRINFLSASGVLAYEDAIDVEVGDDVITFKWLLGAAVFTSSGTLTFSVCLRQINENSLIVKEYNTTKATAVIKDGLEAEDQSDPEQYSILTLMRQYATSTKNDAFSARESAEAAEAAAETARLYLGAPLTAANASDMTNTDRVYVYVGDEVDYTYGNWYYYDGTEWVSGGVYNSAAIQTDETLNVRGAAADSYKVGEITRDLTSRTTDAENRLATVDTKIQNIESALSDVSIDVDDLGLYQDQDTYYVYPTYRGMRSENGIPLASGSGGGGGGGDVINAKLTVENTTGWLSKTISAGSSCVVSFTWSSIEDELSTGDGAIRITVNDSVRASYQIQQGNVSVDLGRYISPGNNKVKIRISDVYDQGSTTTFTITSIELSITSSFDDSINYTGAVPFSYTPVGAVDKTVYFLVDGQLVGTQETSVSGRQLSYSIPDQTHGAHSLRVYYEAEINGETVRSNELYYEFMSVDEGDARVIISSSFNETTKPQYSSVVFPYYVYDPSSFTAEVRIYANNTLVSTQTVDRTRQSYTYRANEYGTLNMKFVSGTTEKVITLTITESSIDVEAETQDLKLYLSSAGRSNQEENPNTWTYDNIECIFNGFNWYSDGWQSDSDGITVMRVSGDARLTIPYKPFVTDFRATGKTIEFEFATRNVLNYDTTILSCMADGRGVVITPQKALLSSEQSSISTQYKEDEHVRIAFVAEKRTENRLIFIYINGIASGVVQYPVDDDFSQVNPVNITVGSNDCTIDLYCVRVYDNDLNRFQILDNWIADTQDGGLMLERYLRNNVFDAYGNIVISNLPSDLPYMIRTASELPQYKGDKKTISVSFVNPLLPSKSFTADGVQSDVQGTSSQYYPRKNYKDKYKKGFMSNSGVTSSKYAMNNQAVPTNTFTMKADVASSEGANNVELVRLYNDACPYKTPSQLVDPKVRQGIDGFPIVMFWNDGNATTFLGKYNFNNDKGTPEVFGFTEDDESWEILNNTSSRVLWKSDDYSDSGWLNDFEARYPDTDPAYTDSSQLAEFAAWVKSTDRTQATNDALDEPVTYDDVEYTADTADYRLAKFKAEAGNYMEMQSTLFYYLFTELFLMVDSRAKNAFPSFMGTEVSGE